MAERGLQQADGRVWGLQRRSACWAANAGVQSGAGLPIGIAAPGIALPLFFQQQPRPRGHHPKG